MYIKKLKIGKEYTCTFYKDENCTEEIKSLEVRKRYLEVIFPQASAEQINSISPPNDLAAQDSDDLRAALDELILLNESAKYFDYSITDRCRLYYQNFLYNEMRQHGIKWGKLFDLRIKQIGKLFFK